MFTSIICHYSQHGATPFFFVHFYYLRYVIFIKILINCETSIYGTILKTVYRRSESENMYSSHFIHHQHHMVRYLIISVSKKGFRRFLWFSHCQFYGLHDTTNSSNNIEQVIFSLELQHICYCCTHKH